MTTLLAVLRTVDGKSPRKRNVVSMKNIVAIEEKRDGILRLLLSDGKLDASCSPEQ